MFNCFGDFLYLSPRHNLRMVLRDKKHEELKRVAGQGGLGESCVCVCVTEGNRILVELCEKRLFCYSCDGCLG